jgi:hypothetical protein
MDLSEHEGEIVSVLNDPVDLKEGIEEAKMAVCAMLDDLQNHPEELFDKWTGGRKENGKEIKINPYEDLREEAMDSFWYTRVWKIILKYS